MTVQELKDKLEAAINKGQGDYQVMYIEVVPDFMILDKTEEPTDITEIEVSTENKTITLK